MMMIDYGKKDGASPTAGKRAETIVDACGARKRVFHGQRWLLVQQRNEADRPTVRAYHTEADAAAQMEFDRGRLAYDVEYVAAAQPL